MYVELKNINKMYNDYKASNDINLGIKKGKLVALLGPWEIYDFANDCWIGNT